MTSRTQRQPGSVGGLAAVVVTVGVLAMPALASAQPAQPPDAPTNEANDADDAERARALRKKAKESGTQGDWEHACALLERSLRLDPRPDVRFNFGVCLKELGKLARSRAVVVQALAGAVAAKEDLLAQLARQHIADIEPLLGRLDVREADDIAPAELQVKIDGEPVEPDARQEPVWVDPGERVVTASARGYEPFRERVTAVEGQVHEVVIELVKQPDLPPPPPPSPTPSTPVTTTTGSARLWLGRGAVIAGGVSIATGLGFGLAARSEWNGAFDDGLCDEAASTCNQEGQAQTDSARGNARVADILVGVGVVAVGAGVYLWLTAPSRETRGVQVVPTVGADGAGAAFIGRF